MIELSLTRGHVALIDDCDVDLAMYKWHAQIGSGTENVYACRAEYADGQKKTFFLHRVILERVLARPLLSGELVDHIHGRTLDNQRSELRLATSQQNFHNQQIHRNNTSGYKGVCFHKLTSKYTAQICVNRKRFHLGLFPTPEAAAHAYNEAALKHFGEFARLNEISQTTNE